MARVYPAAVLEGFKEASRKLRAMPPELKEDMAQAVRETSFSLMQRAKANAPKETGTLVSAITYSVRGLTGRVVVNPAGFYWRFHEYGTRYIPAKGFARAAGESETISFNERMRQIRARAERNFESGRLL
jgi:HK97 gp10 family phage protein